MKAFPLLLAVVCLAPSASAQNAKTEMIPKDVAEDLMGFFAMMGGGMGNASSRSTITLGKVADDLVGKVYLPPTTRVLASTNAMFGTTVLSSTLSRDSTISAFQREMPRLGWKPMTKGFNQGWGFSPAPTAMRDSAFGLCSAGSSLFVI